jgi:octaprenyl-diphosphate synthase
MQAAQAKIDVRDETDLLAPLQRLVENDLKKVNSVILERMGSSVDLIPKLAGHLIFSGGKRLRPMLTMASAYLCGYEGQRHVNLAACVEFIHAATLLHDDVIDESDKRRGQATANALWGNQASILVGDFLFSKAFELMVEDGSLEVLRILSNASTRIAEGEVMQLEHSKNTNITLETYLTIASSKTAALFEASCKVGGTLAEKDPLKLLALADFGLNLGLAFQLIDDILDYAANQEIIDKNVGDDFKEGKITLPVILAYQQGSPEERNFWDRALRDKDQSAQDFSQALSYMRKHNIFEQSLKFAETYTEKAKKSLSVFNDSLVKSALLKTADFSLKRAY